ncbi:UDP-N-acetylmuramoyl-L-alanine--D-glutamate ligase [Patescibacteria group bacterium]|nr:UDP-N-acetylmuramoyl-L-alanine--D-glutamate ligase [Patescibacteria group bacterium]
MTKDQLKGKKIGILGLGMEGQACTFFLTKAEANITVFEQKPESEIDPDLIQELKVQGITCVFGQDAFSHLEDYDLDVLVRSPGIRRALPQILALEKRGVLITSQIQLFFDFSPAKIIGVTGTKGKGTTSTLIYEMLKAEGMDAYLGGNIGKPTLTFLDQLTPQSLVVLELSSFQLEDLHSSPHIAVMLMVTSEHLGADLVGTANYHDSLEAYVAAKRKILAFQTAEDMAVLNRDYPATAESKNFTRGNVYFVSRVGIGDEDGCFVQDKAVWRRIKGALERIINTEEIALPGEHNRENVCAAVMAASLAGVSVSSIQQVIKTFRGLEHRLEFVAEVNGVAYYDDSFSTTPETAIAAIQSFQAPKVLILGGSTKASDFSALAQTIVGSKNIRAIIGIGAEWQRIKEELEKLGHKIPLIEGLQDMPSIVRAATEVAQSGDVVLLSPACASFGLFPNYKVRGDLFKEEVRKLLV